MALDAILAHKREEVARRKAAVSLEAHLAACEPTRRDFAAALRAGRPGFILEAKFSSPSEGTIRPGRDLAQVLESYGRHADAISVLTDERFFGGSLERLAQARLAVNQPLLCKDFILEPYQVAEARRFGADAILLILAAVDDETWRAAAALAERLGMAVLTEVHDEQQLDRALGLEAGIIGVNSRNLRTLAIDPDTVGRLAPRIPADRLVVAESGIRSRADIERLRPHADAVLIGTALMREPDLDAAVRQLVYGRTKICGLMREEDARAALLAGATHGGLVFVDRSPRRVDRANARRVREGAPLQWVGLFAGALVDEVASAAGELGLSAVQLYEYDPGAVGRLRAALPEACETWVAVQASEGIPAREETGAERLLVDAASGERLGGSGRSFDWELLRDRADRSELVLAGGIRTENVSRAVETGAWALDLSSGVEQAPGRKDPDRLREFFSRRRRLPGRGDLTP
ncbi:MAG: bifunctional indole-3-glycerol-phosphate synthase TrpC/phosphoribosylanthranilate isomerase TrpF [Gemmatimonadales bacterium]